MPKTTQIFRKRWYISTIPKLKIDAYLRMNEKEFKHFLYITTRMHEKKIKEWQLHIRSVKQVGETAYG